jgi:hypothetical protein
LIYEASSLYCPVSVAREGYERSGIATSPVKMDPEDVTTKTTGWVASDYGFFIPLDGAVLA